MFNLTDDIHIADIYRKKVDIIAGDLTIEEALKLFDQKHTNGFVIVNEQREPLGVLSIDEIAAAIIPYEFKKNIGMAKAMYKKGFFVEICSELKQKKVAEIMLKDFITVDLKTNLLSLIGIFYLNKLSIIPVVEGKKVIGVVSKALIKKAINKAFTLSNLN